MTISISIADAPIFEGISKKDRRRLHASCTAVDVDAGRDLAEQGRRGGEFGVITAGVASVIVDGERIASLGPGDFFGEMALLGLGDGERERARTASVKADTAVTVEVMSLNEFRSMLADMPDVAARVGRIAVERAASNAI